MALRTKEEIEARITELKKDEQTFKQFFMDIYGDKECSRKIDRHIWRIVREIEILQWVLNNELPF